MQNINQNMIIIEIFLSYNFGIVAGKGFACARHKLIKAKQYKMSCKMNYSITLYFGTSAFIITQAST